MVFGFLRKQFIEVIDWPSQDDSTIAWKFPVADNEIKNGAQLTVREGQVAVFLNEGQIADVFKPGRHTLSTQNLPILTTLGAWKHGFESPFKADIVFISSREFRNCKWGTPQPIVLRDPDFGLVRVRAFGGFGLRIIDSKDFIKECAGVRDFYSRDDIEGVIRKVVVSRFTDALAEMKVGAIDMATKYEELALVVNGRIARTFDSFGIELTNFTIESVNLPEEIQTAIDEQSKMNLMMNNSQKFAQWQVLKGVPDAMKGGSPMQGLASDIALGAVMGKVVSNALDTATSGAAASAQGSGANSAGNTRDPDAKFCPECGVKNAKAAKFCQDCGHKFTLPADV
jgi:membrane protease subunit (stomatin/prohibitin family)